METSDRPQDPYLVTLNISNSEQLNIYNNANVELSNNDRYDLTISKCTDFYQELKDDVSTFVYKA